VRKGIAISILFHVALLTWALGYFASSDQKPKTVSQAPVPVDIMSPSQFTKVKAGKKEASRKKKAAPVAPKKSAAPKKPVKTVKKIAPKPKRKPVKKAAKPQPKPKPVAKAEPKQKPVVKAKPKPKQKPVEKKIAKAKSRPVRKQPQRPAKPKSEFDPENIAALLNKLPDKQTSAPTTRPLAPAPKHQQIARAEPSPYGRRYGHDETMSINEIDAFKAQVSRCWSPPTGGLGSRDLNVRLRIKFKQDGTLARPPELANYSGSPFFQPAAEAAQRAIWQCQPYRMPKDKYAVWQDMILNFDPREMFGG
jgi:hypothetical protein